MRIVVTGGAGFIGSHLCERLIEQGHSVLCVDNFDSFYPTIVKLTNIRWLSTQDRFVLSSIDLCNEAAVDEVVGQFRPDAVFHMAATAGVRPSIERPNRYIQNNIVATQVILNVCAVHSIPRIVMAGSSSVYGQDQVAPFSEDCASDHPRSPYAATKRAMELLAATHASVYGSHVAICRLFTVYGPRQRPDLAISRFVRAISSGQAIRVYGDGSYARDFTYVDDTVRGLIAALETVSGYRVYNLGLGRPASVLDLIATVEKVLGRKAEVEHLPAQTGDVPLTFASVERAQRELSWRAEVSLIEGIQRYVDWFHGADACYKQVGEPWSLSDLNASAR